MPRKKKSRSRKGSCVIKCTRTRKGVAKAMTQLAKIEQEVTIAELHKKIKKDGF